MWRQFSWLNPSETETWRNVAETDSDSATTETFRILPKSNVSQLKTDFDSACFVVVFNLKFLSTFLNMLPIQRLRDLLRLRLRLLQLRRRSLVLSWEKSREFRKRACYIRTLYQNREQIQINTVNNVLCTLVKNTVINLFKEYFTCHFKFFSDGFPQIIRFVRSHVFRQICLPKQRIFLNEIN